MPKLGNSLPKYRKHKATGQAVVTLSGVDHYLGPHGTAVSKREYDRLIAEWLASDRRGVGKNPQDDVTVVQILAAYFEFAKKYYRKDGKQTREVDAVKVVIRDARSLYGRTPAIEFGPLALKAVRQIWIDRGLARPTVNKNMQRLTRMFRWAVAEEIIGATTLHALLAVPGLKRGRCESYEPAPIQPVSIGIVEQTIPHLTSVVRDMVRVQLLTGCRPGEVCNLRPCDIDRSDEIWEFRYKRHKTEHHGRSRTVYIGPECQSILLPYLLRDEQSACFSPRESVAERVHRLRKARTTPLSCGNRAGTNRVKRPARSAGTQYSSVSYCRAIWRACDRAFPPAEPLCQREGETNTARMRRLTAEQKLELQAWQKSQRWSPNRLRHTKGTEIRKKFGLEAAQVILGHAAADITQVYAERDADKAREVARRIG